MNVHPTDRTQTPQARFTPGRVVSTPGVLENLTTSGYVPSSILFPLLLRHVSVDWGSDLDSQDRATNDTALLEGNRILSAYRLPDGEKVWVITEADRSVTTFLLPSEY